MRVLILLFLATQFLMPTSIFSQQIDWSPERIGNVLKEDYLAGATKDFYVIGTMRILKESKYAIYDYDHKKIGSGQIDLKVRKQLAVIEDIIETPSGAFAILEIKDRKNKTKDVYASKIVDGKLGEPEFLTTYLDKVKVTVLSFDAGVITDIEKERASRKQSKDKTKYAIIKSSNVNTWGAFGLEMAVFDQDMKELWSRRFKPDFDLGDYVYEDFIVSNEGLVTILGKSDPTVIDFKVPNDQVKVWRYGKDDTEEFELTIDPKKSMKDAGLFESNSDEVIFGGTYFDKVKSSKIHGVFYSTLNFNTGKSDSKTYEFDEAFLEKVGKNKWLTFASTGRSFSIKHLIYFADGSYSFIAERFSANSNSAAGTVERHKYTTGVIFLPHFSAEGDLINISILDKNFTSYIPDLCSYTVGVYDGKTALVYNDLKTKKEQKELKKKKTVFTDITTFDNSGNLVSEKTLFTNKMGWFDYYIPSESTAVSGDMFLMHGLKGAYKVGHLKMD